jgi:hypothetical protein
MLRIREGRSRASLPSAALMHPACRRGRKLKSSHPDHTSACVIGGNLRCGARTALTGRRPQVFVQPSAARKCACLLGASFSSREAASNTRRVPTYRSEMRVFIHANLTSREAASYTRRVPSSARNEACVIGGNSSKRRSRYFLGAICRVADSRPQGGSATH